jgi:hypothetical protein
MKQERLTMTMTLGNDRVQRKNLSDQLDRLDSILDALSDGLNQAVASTVEEAVGKAVQVAVKEVLSNTELLRLLRSQTAAPAHPQAQRPRPLTLKEILANAWERSRAGLSRWAHGANSGLGRVRAWIATKFWNAAGAVRTKANALGAGCGLAWTTLGALVPFVWKCRNQVAMACVVGSALALGCWWGGPTVAATVSGLAGFAGSLFASVLKTLRRAVSLANPA